jgi:hypothetical protein
MGMPPPPHGREPFSRRCFGRLPSLTQSTSIWCGVPSIPATFSLPIAKRNCLKLLCHPERSEASAEPSRRTPRLLATPTARPAFPPPLSKRGQRPLHIGIRINRDHFPVNFIA